MSFAQFFHQNLIYFILLLIGILVLIGNEWRLAKKAPLKATPALAALLVNHGAALIDIRPAEDFRKGHIAGAKNIPGELFEQKMTPVAPEAVTVIVCKSGESAKEHAQWLRNQGQREVYVLERGMDGWVEEGLPTVND